MRCLIQGSILFLLFTAVFSSYQISKFLLFLSKYWYRKNICFHVSKKINLTCSVALIIYLVSNKKKWNWQDSKLQKMKQLTDIEKLL